MNASYVMTGKNQANTTIRVFPVESSIIREYENTKSLNTITRDTETVVNGMETPKSTPRKVLALTHDDVNAKKEREFEGFLDYLKMLSQGGKNGN